MSDQAIILVVAAIAIVAVLIEVVLLVGHESEEGRG